MGSNAEFAIFPWLALSMAAAVTNKGGDGRQSSPYW